MKRITRAAFGVFVAALLTSGFGCELITAVDRNKIGNGGSAGEPSGGGGAGGDMTGGGGTGGTAGMAGMGGTGGMAGMAGMAGMGGMPCMSPNDCPDPGNDCVQRTCDAGMCGTSPIPAGTPVTMQTAGDCKINACNGAGALVAQDDDTDLPDDGNDCTDDTCDMGTPSHPPLAAGTTCMNGGSVCDGMGACVECLMPTDCPGSDTECQARTCDAGKCGVQNTMADTPVASQTAGDCMVNVCDGNGGVHAIADDLDVEDDGNDCTDNSCNAGMPVTTNTAKDSACGMGGMLVCDGNGACVGCTDAAQCGTPSNQCLVATCDAGMCGTADKPDGTACDDSDACSQTDTCQAGACTGANPVICTAQDQCHVAGTCDPGTGMCDNPTKTDGSACTDGDACTQADTCQAGTCTSGSPVICMAQDQCHDAGTCNTMTGVCDNPNKADGTACNDSNACTQADTCQAGACTGANPVICMAQDQCHDAGTCNTMTGVCDNPNKADGTACNDSNACTQTDTCQAGACTGGNPVICMAQDQCHVAGTCNTMTGVCDNPNKADGSACNDGNGCTQTDTCQAGACTGANPVICMAQDACHLAGTCNTMTGVCDNPNAPDGTVCPGGMCTAGTCIGALCTDMTQNGTETDVDCGGGGCPACGLGQMCLINTDCTSGHCAGNVCVECVAPSDCPGGPDTECHMRTCNSNTCGINNPMSGTPTGMQTTGDCQQIQCDGLGGTMSVADNADIPADDGNQCTDDVCTAGAPDHPFKASGTACSQNGGTQCDGMGNCVTAPNVAMTSPADAAAPIAGTTISVTFTTAMNPATLTGQTAAGACSGSVQVSLDNFASCIAFGAAAASMDMTNTVATFNAAPGLLVNRSYKIRVTTAATSAGGIALPAQYTHTTGFTTTSPNLCNGSLVISQVYGGSSAATSSFKNDFVELHNRGTTTIDLTGLSLQYSASGSTAWGGGTGKTNLTGSVPAGGYFLVQMAAGDPAPPALPTPDLIGNTNLSGTAGKIALVNTTAQLPAGACPDSTVTIDFVSFGSTNCAEGTSTPPPSITTAALRNGAGCTDVNDNSLDFTVAAPMPRNSMTAAAVCDCTAKNESNAALEADYCNVQFPLSLSVPTGMSSGLVYGQIFEAGVTENAGSDASVRAQLGYGPATANPQYNPAWKWFNAAYNTQAGNNDEYQASFTAPAAGSYRYAYRYSLDQGVSWTICDQNAGDFGAGSNGGLSFELADLPVLTVTP